jgi:hypothetical protein
MGCDIHSRVELVYTNEVTEMIEYAIFKYPYGDETKPVDYWNRLYTI